MSKINKSDPRYYVSMARHALRKLGYADPEVERILAPATRKIAQLPLRRPVAPVLELPHAVKKASPTC